MNVKEIYRDLGFSIRKVNKDEIEIKNSTFDGYLRGFFRTLIIGIFSVMHFYITNIIKLLYWEYISQ